MLPEYGGGGDLSGALRRRRAFRFLVLGWIVFTAGLYLTDRYLRNEHTENLYRDSLTMDPGSGRVLLRNAVRTFDSRGELPPVKFLQALAEREEDDLKLAVYARAYDIERERPEVLNPEFVIRYGVQLFLEGKYLDARERFRDAALMAKTNALPLYLEAAAIAATAQSNDDFGRAIAAIANANAAAAEFALPRVLWFQGLPRESKAYADLRRRIADECCAPLYRLTEILAERVEKVAAEQGPEQTEVWLASLEQMGQRILTANDPPAPLAIAGLHVRNEVLRKRIELAGKTGGAPDEALIHRRIKVETALGAVREADARREAAIERNLARVQAPLWTVFETVAILVLAYGAALVVVLLAGPPRDPLALGFGPAETAALWAGPAVFVVVLAALTAGIRISAETVWLDAIRGIWRPALLLVLGVGMAGPFFTLPRIRAAANTPSDDAEAPSDDAIAYRAKSERRMAAIVHSRRFVGRLLGRVILVACIWVLAFRVITGAYPHHAVLIASGQAEAEHEAIAAAMATLTDPS